MKKFISKTFKKILEFTNRGLLTDEDLRISEELWANIKSQIKFKNFQEKKEFIFSKEISKILEELREKKPLKKTKLK